MKSKTPILIATLLFASLPGPRDATAQDPAFSEDRFHGRQAYILENAKMRVAALRGGGHIAEIRLKSDDPKKSVNPMLIHHFQTIDPWEYDPAKHDAIYGGRDDRMLQAGYMGHLLNFPTFGSPSEREAENGLGGHGDALSGDWRKTDAATDERGVRLAYSAHLPKTQYKVGRKLTLPRDETVLYVEEWVESQTLFGRPAHWVQHATFGPPFVAPGRNVLDMSAVRGELRGPADASNTLKAGPIQWPQGTSYDGKQVSLREMQTRPHAGTYYGLLMDPAREESYLTAYNKDLRVLIGYIWRTEDFPWVGDWQENERNDVIPWNGKVIARGLEFGTTPFGGPMRKVVAEGELYGVPQYRWIEGRERLTVRYLAFVTEIPDGYRGVADVDSKDGKIRITERETGRVISLKSERPW